ALPVRLLEGRDVPRRAERHEPGEPRGHRLQLQLSRKEVHHRLAHLAGVRSEGRMVSFWRSSIRVAALLGVLCTAACKPEFSERTSEVLARRVLSVRSDPPEADLESSIKYHALVVTPQGPDTAAPMDWAYCTRPKPVRELNDVNSECFVL